MGQAVGNIKLIRNILFLMYILFVGGVVSAHDVSRQNVVWHTPSDSSFGSMPLGNGDIGMNVWCEENGDILFYISKVDAYDHKHHIRKLGKIRMRFLPALDMENFRQELCLQDATVRFAVDDVVMEICVAANQPLIHISGVSGKLRNVEYHLEPLRSLAVEDEIQKKEGTVGILLPSSDGRLAWAYENCGSVWAGNLLKQTSAGFVSTVKDPIKGRFSGCMLSGNGLVSIGSLSLATSSPRKSWSADIRVESCQPGSSARFLEILSKPMTFDRKSHEDYWREFWDRSFIEVRSCGDSILNLDQCRYSQIRQGSLAYKGVNFIDAEYNARQITQKYALERFCEAIASRGNVPPPYNGSIFTMDMPAGVPDFKGISTKETSADSRDWADLSFMWQNTRHPYWSMATRGDYDCMVKGMEFVRDGLDICKERCRKEFGHDGAYIMEASWWHNVGVFNPGKVPAHLKYHFLATLELPAIMCQYYDHTCDKAFLDSVLLPCADEFIRFYRLHFPDVDERGMVCMDGVGCAETYQNVTNPCTEIGALKYLLDKLCSYGIDTCRKTDWAGYRAMLPDVPLRTVRGRRLLAVGERYEPGRTNCESPELYSVYPFEQVCLDKPDLLSVARQSFFVRTESLDGTKDEQSVETGGWQSAPVQAAYLGLAREAARLMSINFNDKFVSWNDNIPLGTVYKERPRPRFPAFWDRKMDGIPDNDHGANSVNALQSMLLISGKEKIYLLPAWPEDWDVSFRLRASGNTIVDCEYKDGKVVKLEVTPKDRVRDVVNMAAPEQRVRTLVETALSDYNYLYGLPPMQDAIPVAGPVTSSWIEHYGYTLAGCKAGPWDNAVFRGNTVYVHVFDMPAGGIFLPSVGLRLLKSTTVLGDMELQETSDGYTLLSDDAHGHKILKMEFDGDLEPVVLSQIGKGALNGKDDMVVTDMGNGKQTACVAFSEKNSIGRFDFSISNPGHLRGQGNSFVIEARGSDGVWREVYKGSVYGMICAKQMDPVVTDAIRLTVDADEINDFYLYSE